MFPGALNRKKSRREPGLVCQFDREPGQDKDETKRCEQFYRTLPQNLANCRGEARPDKVH